MLLTKLDFRKLPWKLLGVEAMLIVLSVLLALGLDSWREARENRTFAERALQGFVDEARANCTRILSFSDYHRAVVDGEQEPHGLQVGLLRNDAWEVVKTTGAAGWLEYELVAIMSELHTLQRDHRSVMQAYMQAMFTVVLLADPDRSSWHRAGERGVISDLVIIQDDLVAGYRRLSAEAQQHYGNTVDASAICEKPSD